MVHNPYPAPACRTHGPELPPAFESSLRASYVSQEDKDQNLINIQEALQNGGNLKSYDNKSMFSDISSIDSNLSIDSDTE